MSNFQNKYLKNLWYGNRNTFLKTFSYFFMHITVAMIVAFAITKNFWMSVSLSLIEPAVQAFAYFFHERFWTKKIAKQKALDAGEDFFEEKSVVVAK